jgi:hypothetical protein
MRCEIGSKWVWARKSVGGNGQRDHKTYILVTHNKLKHKFVYEWNTEIARILFSISNSLEYL